MNQAAEWLEDRVILLVCDHLWTTDHNDLEYAIELKKYFEKGRVVVRKWYLIIMGLTKNYFLEKNQ